MNPTLRFYEIEHKYVVDEGFDLPRFREALAALGPTKTSSLRVRDRYYLTEGGLKGKFVIRHRFDPELHQLTIKTIEADPEVRREVNLDLGQTSGDQAAQVDAFMACLGVVWSGTIHKDLDVWYFADCEVVHYLASTDSRSIRCVEFEATRRTSIGDALAIIETFERATGFHGETRSQASLPLLLFPELADTLAQA